MKKRLIVGLSGASGAPLGVEVLQILRDRADWETHLVCSPDFSVTLRMEAGKSYDEVAALADTVYDFHDMSAAVSSGTFLTEGMLIVPCSMKTVAGIACGYAENLLLRAADVTIKEGRKLVLVPRETPLSPIHLRNLTQLADLGVRLLPPMLTYYINPASVEDMTRHMAAKALWEFGIEAPGFKRWK